VKEYCLGELLNTAAFTDPTFTQIEPIARVHFFDIKFIAVLFCLGFPVKLIFLALVFEVKRRNFNRKNGNRCKRNPSENSISCSG